jgi:two-component system sensor histidine kinase KdpD
MVPAAVLAVAVTTVVCFLAHRFLQLADIVVLYVLCITAVATRFERGQAILASVLSVVCLDFFFITPRYTLSVEDARYVGTFGMMIGVGWVVSSMAGRIRAQARDAEERERHTAALYRLGGILAEGGDAEALQNRVEAYLGRELGMPVLVLLADPAGVLAPRTAEGAVLNGDERGMAQWTLESREASGAGTQALPGSRALFLPLGSAGHPSGVLALFPAADVTLTARRDLLDAMAVQVSLALSRARLASERTEARIRAEQEHLRSILLSSISHDLRTPLGTISGATSTLLDPGPEATPEDRRMLLQSVQQEAQRLEKLVDNLLDLTRLESGQVQVTKEWVPMEEIVGSALNHLESLLGDRPVTLDLQEAWVPLDPVLMEQVLVNLLDNAQKFSPAGSPLAIQCRADLDGVTLTLTDQGPGFEAGEEERVFEKLYRGSRSTQAPGAGLGLAICRGIIQAHGGTIQATTAPQGGGRVIITLPITGTPPDLLCDA